MKQTKEYIEELLKRFFDGQTTEADEQLLADYFRDVDAVPEEWQAYKELFDSFKTEAYDFSQEELDAMMAPADNKKPKAVRMLPWVSVACVAAIFGLIIWHPWVDNPASETSSVAQVKPMGSIIKTDSAHVMKEKNTEEKTFVADEGANKAICTERDNQELLAEAKPPTNKNHKNRKALPLQEKENKSTQPTKETAQPANSQEITTSELLETISLLIDVGNETITITSLHDNEGYAVRTVSNEGESNSYMLRRCAESSSLELKSQFINF